MKKTPLTPEEKKQHRKYAIVVVVGFILFITGSFYFYNYMNAITAKDHLEEGKKMEARQKDMFALEYYSEAIGYDETLTEAYLRRAGLLIKIMKDYNGAAKDYSKVLEQRQDAGIYFKRAKCYIKLKNYDAVMSDLDKAISLTPQFDSLYFYKAEVNSFILNKHQEAIQSYSRALSLNPKFHEALLGRALSRQSVADYRGSIQDFNQLIQQKPEEGSYYYYRGYSQFENKDTASACNDWFQAERLYYSEARNPLNQYCLEK